MRHEERAGGLADAADLLSRQLKGQLRRLAGMLYPRAASLEGRFVARLRQLGYGPKQRKALTALTPGAAARILARGHPVSDFLEQVEYNGRRLAKLNLPPRAIVEALAEFDRLLTPVVRRLGPQGHNNLEWVRGQLQFCVLLALNKAYHQVREAEAEAFYQLSHAELEARNLDGLLQGSLAVLTRFCGAQEAILFLADGNGAGWDLRATAHAGGPRGALDAVTCRDVRPKPARKRLLARPRSVRTTGRSAQVLLVESWRSRFASVWSVPLLADRRLAGVMQFGFARHYDWFPREQELLEAAAKRCLAAAERARLMDDLSAREKQVCRLAEHMLHVEEEERRRISRELHDEAGQSLLYIRLQLELLEKELPGDRVEWRQRLVELRRVTEHTILEARRLISALSPAVLEQLGLAPALRQLLKRLRQAHPCHVRVRFANLEVLPKKVATVVYRLVQECCNNIAKHSQASAVNISVYCTDGRLRLRVEDNGVGFRSEAIRPGKDGLGLAGMQERVTLLGGHFEVRSTTSPAADVPGNRRTRTGTKILAELPLSVDRA